MSIDIKNLSEFSQTYFELYCLVKGASTSTIEFNKSMAEARNYFLDSHKKSPLRGEDHSK